MFCERNSFYLVFFIAYVVRLNQRESVLMESSNLRWLTVDFGNGRSLHTAQADLVYLIDLIVCSFFFFLFLLIQIKYALCINVSRKNFLAVPIHYHNEFLFLLVRLLEVQFWKCLSLLSNIPRS